MMRKYETIFILHPSLDEEAVKANIEKFKGVIENGGGTIENVDFWGKRKLAYEISYYYKKKCSIDGINEADFITHLSSENEKLLNVLGEINRLGLKEEFTQDEIDDYINVINEFNLKKECNNLGEKIHNELSPIEKAKLLQRIIDLKKQD